MTASRSLFALFAVVALSMGLYEDSMFAAMKSYGTIACTGPVESTGYFLANVCMAIGDGGLKMVIDDTGATYTSYNTSDCEDEGMPFFTWDESDDCFFGQSLVWPVDGKFVVQATFDDTDCESTPVIGPMVFIQDVCNSGQMWMADDDSLTVCNDCTETDDGDCTTVPYPNAECLSIGNETDPFSLLYAYNVVGGDGVNDDEGNDGGENSAASAAPAVAVVSAVATVLFALLR